MIRNQGHVFFSICVLAFFSNVDTFQVSLEKVSTIYLPYEWSDHSGAEVYNMERALEQASVDAKANIVYAVGNTNIFVVDFSNISLQLLYKENVGSDQIVTDVEQCGDHFAISVDDIANEDYGYINIYEKYNKTTGTMPRLQTIYVGNLPDMLLPTKDCLTIVVAVEAPPRSGDPAGGIGIISFATANWSGNYTYTMLNFSRFDSLYPELALTGVRFAHQTGTNSFSDDLEPEYITFNADETKAYISLQENNAIAVVDMETNNITNIYGLGFKDWSISTLDVSDKDGSINMKAWPVYGIYQPDCIKYVTVNGHGYIITANEGQINSEEPYDQVQMLAISSDFGTPADILSLKEEANLGRLQVSLDGYNSTSGMYYRLYTYGGRSFSIWDAEDLSLVYDSGNSLETVMARDANFLFNCDHGTDKTIEAERDDQSNNRGCEPETLATAEFDDVLVIFVSCERPGIIFMYSIDTTSAQIEPKYEGLYYDVPHGKSNLTWQELYDQREISAIDPEDIQYINADNSPTNSPLLIVVGEQSGTITMLNVKVTFDGNSESSEEVDVVSKVFVAWMMCMLPLQ